MTYKIFELVRTETNDQEMDSYALKDLNEVYDEKFDAENRIEDFKRYSFSMFTILKIY